jgi:membrane protease YdiL (CAAX protease family)
MKTEMKKMGLIPSFAVFISASLLMFLLTKYLIPCLSLITGQETILFWFIVAGLGVFLPLIITGVLILRSEGRTLTKDVWVNRLRFKKMRGKDILWSLGGIIVIGALSGLIMKVLEMIIGKFDHSPSFMSFEPLTSSRYWLLLIWLPYWILNIFGEEFLWRGIMMPRQEIAFGKYTWLIHGFGWGVFHIAFGWQLLITLMPIIFIQSYIIQKTKNTWVGVIIHGGINGPSFIAIALGLI